jgi:hypothetical protein
VEPSGQLTVLDTGKVASVLTLVGASLTTGVTSTDAGSTTTSVVSCTLTGVSVEVEQPTAKIIATVDTKLAKFILPPL